jgi:hypothetical protein
MASARQSSHNLTLTSRTLPALSVALCIERSQNLLLLIGMDCEDTVVMSIHSPTLIVQIRTDGS